MVRVLGPQGAVSSVKLNVPVPVPDGQGNVLSHVFDLARGKYDLTVETGPSFTTRREEAASQMTELIRAYPAAAPVLGDLLAKNLDWPDADEIAKRLASLLPAAANGGDGQANAMLNKLQQQIAALTAQLQGIQSDRTLDAEKLRIDSYKAQTDRLKLTADIAQKNGLAFGVMGFASNGQGANAQETPVMGTMTARRTIMAADSSGAPADGSIASQDSASAPTDVWEPSSDNRFVTPRPEPVGDPPSGVMPLKFENPGAVFDDIDAAAKDIHGLVNPISKGQNLEYGWKYYFDNTTGKIGYTDPVSIGQRGGSNIQFQPLNNGKIFDPNTITELRVGHTHGDYSVMMPGGRIVRSTRYRDPLSDAFSNGRRDSDMYNMQSGPRNQVYTLGTPSGKTLKWTGYGGLEELK